MPPFPAMVLAAQRAHPHPRGWAASFAARCDRARGAEGLAGREMDEVGAVRTAQRAQEQVLGCEAGVRRVETLRTATAAVARAAVAGVAARRDRAIENMVSGLVDSRMGCVRVRSDAELVIGPLQRGELRASADESLSAPPYVRVAANRSRVPSFNSPESLQRPDSPSRLLPRPPREPLLLTLGCSVSRLTSASRALPRPPPRPMQSVPSRAPHRGAQTSPSRSTASPSPSRRARHSSRPAKRPAPPSPASATMT